MFPTFNGEFVRRTDGQTIVTLGTGMARRQDRISPTLSCCLAPIRIPAPTPRRERERLLTIKDYR